MAGENETGTAASVAKGSGENERKRERSSIGFPYMDLNDALVAATAIHENVGTGPCSSDQLAAWVGQSPASSAFRVRMSTSRLFGLVDTKSGDSILLTELGRMAVDPTREQEARANAFLRVPLYQALFEKFKGTVLPPTAALEREIVSLGVAEKQKSRARQVFERAAEQGGFFLSGPDRLVKPGISQRDTPPPEPEKDINIGTGGGGGDDNLPPGIDLIITGLLKRLPKSGDVWPVAERKLWLELLSGSFDLIYKTEDKANMSPNVDQE